MLAEKKEWDKIIAKKKTESVKMRYENNELKGITPKLQDIADTTLLQLEYKRLKETNAAALLSKSMGTPEGYLEGVDTIIDKISKNPNASLMALGMLDNLQEDLQTLPEKHPKLLAKIDAVKVEISRKEKDSEVALQLKNTVKFSEKDLCKLGKGDFAGVQTTLHNEEICVGELTAVQFSAEKCANPDFAVTINLESINMMLKKTFHENNEFCLKVSMEKSYQWS